MPTTRTFWTDIQDAPNTLVVDTDGGKEVVLYQTKIFVISYPSRTVTLRHDGHTTDTTKRRMNACFQAADLSGTWEVRQSDWDWFVKTPAGEFEFEGDSITLSLDTGKPVA